VLDPGHLDRGYANARGTYTSTVSKHGSQDYTVTLVG
jgi:hypothetical protein